MKKIKKLSLILMLLIATVLAFAACGSDKANEGNESEDAGAKEAGVEINVSAAASLTEALDLIKEEYSKESNDTLFFNFAGSGALQKQIAEGAPCDLFISASKGHMDELETAGLIDTDSRKDLLGNALTLIASAEKADTITLENLNTDAVSSLSIGEPETVPAGKYGQQSLEAMGVWDSVKDKIVYGKDVKNVLEYVDTGNVDCGLVYRSDALGLTTGKIIGEMAEDSHDPIIYPAALIAGSENSEAAAKFYEFLESDYAKGVFEEFGFTVL